MDLFNCWISPKGKIHRVGYMAHIDFAYEYIDENNLENDYDKQREKDYNYSGSDFLESLNWKRVMTWQSGKTLFIDIDDPKTKWTKSQIKSVVNICIDRKIEIPERFKPS